MAIKCTEENRRSAKKDMKDKKWNYNRMGDKQKGEKKAVINSKQYVSVQVNGRKYVEKRNISKLCDVFTAFRAY